jgi:hypothetical protein
MRSARLVAGLVGSYNDTLRDRPTTDAIKRLVAAVR